MDTFSNYQLIVDFYYNNPHQYMSLTVIYKHAVEHNTEYYSHFTTRASLRSCMTPL